MRDFYLYEGTDILKNLLNIRDRKSLEEAEADYVTYRFKEIASTPLPGAYDYQHLLKVHKYLCSFCRYGGYFKAGIPGKNR